MKFKKLSLGLFLMTIFVVTSAFKFTFKDEAFLIGKWKYVDYYPNAKSFDSKLEDYKQKMQDLKLKVLGALKAGYIDMKADHTYEMFDGKMTKNGTWKLSDDGKILTTTNSEGEAKPKEISLLTNEKLQFTMPNPKNLTDLFFMEKVK